jgi:hypothetical protein
MKRRLFTSHEDNIEATADAQQHRFDQPWTITNPVTAALLARPDQFRYLRPFHGRAASAADVARGLKVSLPRLRYWIMRALDAGLLVEVPAERRRGRKVRRYRTRSDVLYLPARSTADATLAPLVALWSDAWQQRFVQLTARIYERAGIRGLRLAGTPDGDVRGEWVTGPDQGQLDYADPRLPPLYGGWDLMRLDEPAARELQRELMQLRERYLARGGSGQYLLRLGLVPSPEPGVF